MEIPIGRALRDVRLHCKLSQGQLAERMDLTRTYISRIETGQAMPTLGSIFRFAAALEIEPHKIVKHAWKLSRYVSPELHEADNACVDVEPVQLSA